MVTGRRGKFSGKTFAQIRAIIAKEKPALAASRRRARAGIRGIDPETGIRTKVRTQELLRRARKGSGSQQETIRRFASLVSKQRPGIKSVVAQEIARRKQLAAKRPAGVVGLFKRPPGIRGIGSDLTTRVQTLRTIKLRGKASKLNEAELTALSLVKPFVDAGISIAALPSVVEQVIRNPASLKTAPGQVKRAFQQELAELSFLAKVSPNEFIARIGGEILLLKGVSKTLKFTEKGLKKGFNKVAQKISKREVGELTPGKKITLPPEKGKKPIRLEVVEKFPREELPRQIARAGKPATIVSTQADALVSLLKRKRVVMKPIPGEEKLTGIAKGLLKKFDEGKITKQQVIQLDRILRKQKGAKGILERSFFADPTGKLRPSRLGLFGDEEAGLLDLLAGDVALKAPKPQILVFEKIKIAKLPKSLSIIKKKLSKNQPLTERETDALLTFQLKKSGKFKPIGFLSKEREVTLPPGEIIKKGRKIGTATFKGKRIPIVTAEVFKPKGEVKKLLSKLRKNKITKKQATRLDKLLKKKTGIDYRISSKRLPGKKIIPIRRIGLSSIVSRKARLSRAPVAPISTRKRISRPSKRRKVSKRPISPRTVSRPSPRPTSRPRPRPSKRPPKSPPRGPPSRPPRAPPRSPPRIPPKVPPRAPPRIPPKIPPKLKPKKREKKRKGVVGYAVLEKRGKKFVKLRSKPLTFADAKDKLAFRINNKISRTAKIVKIGKVKRVGTLKGREKGAFARNRKNLREFKIRKGKRIKTPNTFIERKGKAVINTPGEKRQLLLNRLAKARRIKASKTKKRRR